MDEDELYESETTTLSDLEEDLEERILRREVEEIEAMGDRPPPRCLAGMRPRALP